MSSKTKNPILSESRKLLSWAYARRWSIIMSLVFIAIIIHFLSPLSRFSVPLASLFRLLAIEQGSPCRLLVAPLRVGFVRWEGLGRSEDRAMLEDSEVSEDLRVAENLRVAEDLEESEDSRWLVF